MDIANDLESYQCVLIGHIDIKYVFLFTMNDTDEGIHTVEIPLVHEKILHASSHSTVIHNFYFLCFR